MSSQANKEIVRRLLDEAFNHGNLKVADEVLTADYQNHDLYAPAPITSPAAMKDFIRGLRAGIPDVHFTMDEPIAEGDRVAYRWTARGTQTGPAFGVPPTGRSCVVTGTNIARIVDGKIAEEWGNWDLLGMLQQLGVAPAPAAASH